MADCEPEDTPPAGGPSGVGQSIQSPQARSVNRLYLMGYYL
jgi:hypothetical protein